MALHSIMDNQQFRTIFRDIASLLEIQGNDLFRVRAYRRAAETVGYLSESVRSIARRGALQELPGIGKTLEREIQELLETGHLRYYENLQAAVPDGLLALLRLPSLSTEQVRTLWRQHDIITIKQLVHAFRTSSLPFDPPTLVALERDLGAWEREQHRMLLGVAWPRVQILLQNLARLTLVEQVSVAGSLRRGLAMVADINIVMASSNPPQLIHLCNQQPEVRQIIDTSHTSTQLITSEGLYLALVAVLPTHFASALLHYTGSAAHRNALQRLAQRYGWRLTEHGFINLSNGQPLTVPDEADIYHHCNCRILPPNCGKIRARLKQRRRTACHTLVTLEDIRGDLHVHSAWGDGAHSLEDIAHAGQRLGYQYVAICDYAYAAATGRGLTPDVLRQQIEAIRQLNATLPETFRLLAGIEVEIAPNGAIDFDEQLLQELDIVIAAAHTGLREARNTLTRRLCKAMEHPLVDVLAHPAGRMLGRSDTPLVDLEAVLETAAETHTFLEINSHILRLDLEDKYVRQARDLGLTLTLGSGAHNIQEMGTMHLGVRTARRGWVEPQHLLNTLSCRHLLRRLKDQDVTNVR